MIEDFDTVERFQYPQSSIADHDVLLSFGRDSDAIHFREWLAENWREFQLYVRSQQT